METIHNERMDTYNRIHELNKVFGFTIPLDAHLTLIKKKPVVDIIRLDQMFEEHDKEYSHLVGIYKGKSCSMQEYVLLNYGREVLNKLIPLV